MRKIFYSLGAVAAVTTPIIATVSCGSDDNSSSEKHYPAVPTRMPEQTQVKQEVPTPIEQKVPTPSLQEEALPEQKTPSLIKKNPNDPVSEDVSIIVRIPDLSKEEKFDEAKFDSSKYIENWHYVRRQPVHSMVPYTIDRTFKFAATVSTTLGGLMDELNRTGDIFKFNMDLASAGDMGRFLMGIKKSDEALSKVKDLNTESYWGIHYEDNGYGDTIMTSDAHSSYISLSSPNNKITVLDSHTKFDPNESFYFFDQRLPKGVDNIPVSSHDIFYLNLWWVM